MILSINCSTLQYGIALVDMDGIVVSEYVMALGKGHFGELMPVLDELFVKSNIDKRKLKCIAVAIGPGSFTGLRVGISLAKGVCHALHLPIIGVSSLESMALQIPHSKYQVVPVLDSRKEELFTALFSLGDNGTVRRKSEDTCLRISDFPSIIKEPSVFIGNNYLSQAPALMEALGKNARFAPASLWNLRASSVAWMALSRFKKNDFDDIMTLTPLYLRGPDIRKNPHPGRTD
jgi:tRNA threonylcarbamoyladenosine biosynthesis protein TsaB